MLKHMHKQKTIFIVGPQLTMPGANAIAFAKARAALERQGFVTSGQQHTDGTALRDCDGVAVLPGITPAEIAPNVVLREARAHNVQVKTVFEWLES